MSFSTNNFMMNFMMERGVDPSKQTDTAKFVNEKEKRNYETMLKNIDETGGVRISDTLHIIGNLWRSRSTFKQSISER